MHVPSLPSTPPRRWPGVIHAAVGVVLYLVPLTAAATPAFTWDFKTYYPHAETLQPSLTSQQQASITQLDGYYPTTMVNATGAGLTATELSEVAAMPAYFLLSRDPQSGELSGRTILLDDEGAAPEPDTTQPAGFNGDFVTQVMRLTDLYAKATAAQAPQLEQVYSDLIEHFLNQNYLPGGQPIIWIGNGYIWRDRGWKTLRMVHKLSADKRDLFALSLAYVSGFKVLMTNDGSSTDLYSSVDHYHNGYPTAQKALSLMSDTPAKWQLMQMIRRGYDISIIGKEGNPKNQIVPLDGSIIHHDGHNPHYARYTYSGILQTHLNWTSAGFTSPYTATTIERLRKGSLAWCFAMTGGSYNLHQRMETELLAASAPGTGGMGEGLDFAVRAARLTAAYHGTSIANDLEMAYAAIGTAGVGSTSLPVEWRGITPPSSIDPASPLYTASLMGSYSHTTNGTAVRRGPGQWYASMRGQPTHWRGGESRYAMGTPTHFNAKSMHGSMMLIATGKNGRKPNEVDSGYFRDGWDYSYFPNVTCPDIPLNSLLYWTVWAYFGGESNLTGSADLRDSGVWMMKGNSACKSAFMFGNRIVLVNNNITGSNLHTGLIQYGHTTPSSEPLVLNGSSQTANGDWTLSAGGNHKIVDAQGNGYFVHAAAETPAIKARRGSQSTTYALPENWIGSGPAQTYTYSSDFIANLSNFSPTTANFSKVWFDHGASAANQAMEYTVLVKPQAGELDSYATAMASPATAPVKVTRTSKIHRYQDRESGTCAAAVFDANEPLVMHDLVSVNRPGAYIWRSKDGLLRLSVSSSETENTNAFQVTLKGEWTLESEEGTYSASAIPANGNTVVSLSYRQAAPQTVVLRRTGNNSAPTWFSPTLAQVNAAYDVPFSGSLTGDAGDADTGDTLTFSKVSGPAWLNIASNGVLSGTQSAADSGANVFTIRATDANGAYTDVTLVISVPVPVGSGTWANLAGGLWRSTANWNGGAVANGTDKIADFSTLDLSADATITMNDTISVGGLVFGDTTPNKNWILNASGGLPLTLSVSSGAPTITVSNQSATLNAVLAGTQGFTKSGAGALNLAGANTFTGPATVNQGTASISGNQAAAMGGWLVSSPTSNPIVNFLAGSTIVVGNGRSVSLNGGNPSGGAMTLNVAGSVTNNGSLSSARLGVLNLNSGADWMQNGTMAVATSSSTFGSANMTVNAGAAFTYTGAAAISLSPSGGSSGSASLTVAGGTFITGVKFSNTVASSTGAANLTLSSGGTLKLTADIATLATTSGSTFNVRLGNGGGIVNTNGFATTITQGIANVSGQTGSLTKRGTGTLTLSGASTYTGATAVEAGMLLINGSLANSATTIASTGTLGGTGTLAGPVSNNGTLDPGNQGVGNLTVKNTVTLAGGSAIQWEVSNWAGAAGTGWDKLTTTSLNISATAANPTVIRLAGVALTNFSEANASFVVAETTTGISSFSADKFVIDDSALTLPQGSWAVQQSGNHLVLVYTRFNNAPIFTSNPIIRPSTSAGANYSGSIASAASDEDAGETHTFSKVSGPAWLSVAANGALSGIPGSGDIGNQSWTVRVTDSQGASTTATLNITVASQLPAGWAQTDIGSVGVPGSSSESNGTYTLRGSGAGIGGTADAFQFSSETLDGDGEIRARVTSQSNTNASAKAGVMLRETTGPGSVHALIAITPGQGFIFQYRTATGGNTTTVAGPALNVAPNNWVRLTRSGTLITAYVSADGTTWTQVGTAVVSMTSSINAGLAVTSHNNTQAGTATFDNVSVTPFPPPWQTVDIGATGLQGSAEYFSSKFTVKGAGTIGGNADKFRFVYQMLSGDGEIKVRIASPQNTGTGARLGVMIRDALTPDSPFAFMGVNGGSNFYWQRRRNYGSGHNTTAGGTGAAPGLWVKVVRTGNTLRGYKSVDGVNWTIVNAMGIDMGATIYIGMAVSSGDTTTLNTSVFDNVEVVP